MKRLVWGSGTMALVLVIGAIAPAAQDEGRIQDFDGAVACASAFNPQDWGARLGHHWLGA